MYQPFRFTIPIALLSGLTLYMGVVATFGVQFFKRLELLFMAPSQHPYIEYLDNVSIAELLLHTWRFPRHTRDTAVSVGRDIRWYRYKCNKNSDKRPLGQMP